MTINQATYATPRLDLGEALTEHMLNEGDFIAADVLPTIGVSKEAATFSVIKREGLLRRTITKRSAGSNYNRDSFETEDKSYACVNYGHEQTLPVEDIARYEGDFDAEFTAAEIAYRRILMDREVRTAAILNDVTASGWNSGDNSEGRVLSSSSLLSCPSMHTVASLQSTNLPS